MLPDHSQTLRYLAGRPFKNPKPAVAAVCDRRFPAQFTGSNGAHRAPLQFLNGLPAQRPALFLRSGRANKLMLKVQLFRW